jgi:nucleotide-binding universal stress UspA family protein
MFTKILFATSGSPTCDNAAKVAFELADKYNAKLLLLHVVGSPSRGFSPYVVDNRTGEEVSYDPEYVEWVKEELKTTYAKQLEKAKDVTIEARAGVPHNEIMRLARQEDVDLIVVGAHTRSEDPGASRYRAVAGNTMQKVAQRARCPVLIVNRPCETCFWYFSNIVFGTDFSKAADSAFAFAYKMAKSIGCKLYLFHALDISAIYAGKTPDQGSIEKSIKEATGKIKALYVERMEDFDNYEIVVREGIPYVEILKFAREKSGDLLVMAHHTRDIDPEEAELGSTVEQVVMRSACPVASVNRPDKVALDEKAA